MFKKLTTLILGLTFLAACSPAPTASVFLKQVELNDSTQQIEVPEDIKTSIFEMATEITPDYFLASDKDNQILATKYKNGKQEIITIDFLLEFINNLGFNI